MLGIVALQVHWLGVAFRYPGFGLATAALHLEFDSSRN